MCTLSTSLYKFSLSTRTNNTRENNQSSGRNNKNKKRSCRRTNFLTWWVHKNLQPLIIWNHHIHDLTVMSLCFSLSLQLTCLMQIPFVFVYFFATTMFDVNLFCPNTKHFFLCNRYVRCEFHLTQYIL